MYAKERVCSYFTVIYSQEIKYTVYIFLHSIMHNWFYPSCSYLLILPLGHFVRTHVRSNTLVRTPVRSPYAYTHVRSNVRTCTLTHVVRNHVRSDALGYTVSLRGMRI
jgi:hypothetical protein